MLSGPTDRLYQCPFSRLPWYTYNVGNSYRRALTPTSLGPNTEPPDGVPKLRFGCSQAARCPGWSRRWRASSPASLIFFPANDSCGIGPSRIGCRQNRRIASRGRKLLCQQEMVTRPGSDENDSANCSGGCAFESCGRSWKTKQARERSQHRTMAQKLLNSPKITTATKKPRRERARRRRLAYSLVPR